MIKGRGSASNPQNRFETVHRSPEEEGELTLPMTQFVEDRSRTIIAYNDSPDVGFEASINPYRGCEHGCAYCYARPTHEYLGYSAGLDFETKIVVKQDAPLLLRQELQSRRWKPQVLAMSGVTDPYQPIEGRLQLTRKCLEVLFEFRNPVVIITKNRRVVRDIDLLSGRPRCLFRLRRSARMYAACWSREPLLRRESSKRSRRSRKPAFRRGFWLRR